MEKYPVSHGVFLNDVSLLDESPSIAHACRRAGYDTGYIGKWHLLGSENGYENRAAFIPRERRLGFDFWMAMECTYEYNASDYFGDVEPSAPTRPRFSSSRFPSEVFP